MSAARAVEVERLGKCYRVYPRPSRRLLEALTLGRVRGHREFWGLRGVDLAVEGGTSLGLCGANGAGKSTLLSVLSGITQPSEGRYRIRGRAASILELGTGFNLDFSGRANIFLNGIMMGYGRREMAERVERIVEFSGLGHHIDEPVRTYSTGMGLRLGFSIAVAVDPDVLIIDEVFAVGDMRFQKRCVDTFLDFKRRGKTILFCSHNTYELRQLCDRVLWLRDGGVAALGDPIEVTNEYAAFQRRHGDGDGAVGAPAGEGPAARAPDPDQPRIVAARLVDLATGRETDAVTTGDSVELRIWWRNPRPEAPIHLACGFMRRDMVLCAGLATHFDGPAPRGSAGCTGLRLPELRLLAGEYLVPIWIQDEAGVHRYHESSLAGHLTVRSRTGQVGVFDPEHAWIEHADLPPPDARGAGGASSAEGAGPDR